MTGSHTDRCQHKLIVRADDFGSSPGTNEAILDAVDTGSVRNVGLMAVGPSLLHCLDALRERAKGVCMGLQATINSEWEHVRWGPISEPNRVAGLLANDGHFHKSPQDTNQSCRLQEIEQEIRAQLNHLRSLDLPIRYLDTHMSFQFIEGVKSMLTQLCKEEDLIYGSCNRIAHVQLSIDVSTLSMSCAHFLDELSLDEKACNLWALHPAYPDSITEKLGLTVSQKRHAEAKFLIKPDFQEVVKERGISLVKYDDCF